MSPAILLTFQIPIVYDVARVSENLVVLFKYGKIYLIFIISNLRVNPEIHFSEFILLDGIECTVQFNVNIGESCGDTGATVATNDMRRKSAIQKCIDLGSNCVGVHEKSCKSNSDIDEYELCESGLVTSCATDENCKLGQKLLTKGRHHKIITPHSKILFK